MLRESIHRPESAPAGQHGRSRRHSPSRLALEALEGKALLNASLDPLGDPPPLPIAWPAYDFQPAGDLDPSHFRALPGQAPFSFLPGQFRIAGNDLDHYHAPWRVLVTELPEQTGDGPSPLLSPPIPPWASPLPFLSEPEGDSGSGPDAILIPNLDELRLDGSLQPDDRYDLFRLPIPRDLRLLKLGIQSHSTRSMPRESSEPGSELAVWLFDADGRLMGDWTLPEGHRILINLMAVRSPRHSELVLAIEQRGSASDLSVGSSSASNTPVSLYSIDVSRVYRGQAEPVTPPSSRENAIADQPSAAETRIVRIEPTPAAGGAARTAPAFSPVSPSKDQTLGKAPVGLVKNGPGQGRRSSPSLAAPATAGLLGSDELVDAGRDDDRQGDAESEPLVERLVRPNRLTRRKADTQTVEPSVAVVDLLAEGETTISAEQTVDQVLETWDGPRLAASLLIEPSSLGGVQSRPGPGPLSDVPVAALAPPPPLPPPSPSDDRLARREDPAPSLPTPTVQTAVVTTAALVAGLWLPDLRGRPSGAKSKGGRLRWLSWLAGSRRRSPG